MSYVAYAFPFRLHHLFDTIFFSLSSLAPPDRLDEPWAFPPVARILFIENSGPGQSAQEGQGRARAGARDLRGKDLADTSVETLFPRSPCTQ